MANRAERSKASATQHKAAQFAQSARRSIVVMMDFPTAGSTTRVTATALIGLRSGKFPGRGQARRSEDGLGGGRGNVYGLVHGAFVVLVVEAADDLGRSCT